MVKPLSSLPHVDNPEPCARCGKAHVTRHQHESCTKHRTQRDELGNLRPCLSYRVPGLDVCRLHGGGSKRSQEKAKRLAAAAEYEKKLTKAVAIYGIPREVDPAVGLIEEYWRTAGIVDALEKLVAQLTVEESTFGIASETTKTTDVELPDGEELIGAPAREVEKVVRREARPHILVTQFERERERFSKLGVAIVSLGLEARRDEYVRAQVDVFANVLGQLNLTDDQRLEAARLLRKIDQRPAINVGVARVG